ncbi:hypothetical protein D9V37_02005 [Nocardioides mangrovicus]|uniref:Uncharacterized protein n=1 Tax=Nocardioides mangrovicus TaxID=2478913 RepID=A0A3L8P5R5_9ACTN|nr:hypothetical protein [Nocardioides mangrovicus]RLV50756.1 hypothetical protein D9V37_02005 [Nocardioides mangrovicus]
MPDEKQEAPPKKPFLGLSLTQLVGGSAAAATAAVLGARLGTTGTIIGAALVSLVSAVASAIYQASIRRTQEVVARTKEMLPTTITWRTSAQDVPNVPEVAEQAVEEGVEESTPSVWSRIGWKSVAVATGVFFAITAVLVTGYELVSGQSLEGSGPSTVSNAFHGGTHSSSSPTPTPSVTPSEEPSKSASSSSSSSPTTSATPSQSATPDQTASSTPTPSTSASATTSPSASATASASPTQ